ncbi:MAG TPA: tRNA lysidine(34) synthetase TilS [Candidatus Saccharimonadales bacterium]|nr:tRNA lysidine(34) synthetase TilS [Candidatus Saccharimonadales bacterium]
MNVKLLPGKYVLAVSGGVDSMVLLDLLASRPGLDLVVAHFDHGIRPGSTGDAQFVKTKAQKLNLAFELGQGRLGPAASEEQARRARYDFLESTRARHNALAIVTAHHQDDLIETALINTIRGTGPQGLTAILRNQEIVRPLLSTPKAQILDYARAQNLDWVEDETNTDERYLRNWVRARLMPKLSETDRQKLLTGLYRLEQVLDETNVLMDRVSRRVIEHNIINRAEFTSLPQAIGQELLYRRLKALKVPDLDRRTVERLAVAIRTAKAGTKQEIKKDFVLKIKRDTAQIAVANRGWYN